MFPGTIRGGRVRRGAGLSGRAGGRWGGRRPAPWRTATTWARRTFRSRCTKISKERSGNGGSGCTRDLPNNRQSQNLRLDKRKRIRCPGGRAVLAVPHLTWWAPPMALGVLAFVVSGAASPPAGLRIHNSRDRAGIRARPLTRQRIDLGQHAGCGRRRIVHGHATASENAARARWALQLIGNARGVRWRRLVKPPRDDRNNVVWLAHRRRLRMRRSFAMWRFAAALPFVNRLPLAAARLLRRAGAAAFFFRRRPRTRPAMRPPGR